MASPTSSTRLGSRQYIALFSPSILPEEKLVGSEGDSSVYGSSLVISVTLVISLGL